MKSFIPYNSKTSYRQPPVHVAYIIATIMLQAQPLNTLTIPQRTRRRSRQPQAATSNPVSRSQTSPKHRWGPRLRGKQKSLILNSQQRAQLRRQQVREAQRAYRSRQQSLLGSLKARVDQLEDAMDQLGHIMDCFHNQVTSQAVSLPRSKLIQSTILLHEEINLQLTQTKSSPSDYHRAETSCTTQHGEFQEKLTTLLSAPYTYGADPGADTSSSSSSSSSSSAAAAAAAAPRASHESAAKFLRRFLGTNNHPLLPHIKSTNHADAYPINSPICSRPDTPTPTFIKYTTTTTTAFTQKFFRACAEGGHRYLSNPALTDQDLVGPQFALLMQHLPRHEIISYLERVLQTTPCNPARDSRFPFICLGGAGTQYPGLSAVWSAPPPPVSRD
ncbi:hypothetical protein ARAM_004858 [Aspergillus rambellii]|uniref:BZIP domain-containing protein n=1 Tax=Aspergillus rambellii TaxID=308745 RepID=A0A0F8WLS6_9EURO|nr:hypothetical protein ARAM_004858 [Aspergillus rambellii]